MAASHKRAVRHLTQASSVKALEGLGTRTFRRFPFLLRLVNPASPPDLLPAFPFLHSSTMPSPWRRKWQPTPVFLPGESHGQRSLAGYSPWGHTQSDTTEHTTACPPPAPCRSVPLVLSSFLFEAVLGVWDPIWKTQLLFSSTLVPVLLRVALPWCTIGPPPPICTGLWTLWPMENKLTLSSVSSPSLFLKPAGFFSFDMLVSYCPP